MPAANAEDAAKAAIEPAVVVEAEAEAAALLVGAQPDEA